MLWAGPGVAKNQCKCVGESICFFTSDSGKGPDLPCPSTGSITIKEGRHPAKVHFTLLHALLGHLQQVEPILTQSRK